MKIRPSSYRAPAPRTPAPARTAQRRAAPPAPSSAFGVTGRLATAAGFAHMSTTRRSIHTARASTRARRLRPSPPTDEACGPARCQPTVRPAPRGRANGRLSSAARSPGSQSGATRGRSVLSVDTCAVIDRRGGGAAAETQAIAGVGGVVGVVVDPVGANHGDYGSTAPAGPLPLATSYAASRAGALCLAPAGRPEEPEVLSSQN